jgi:hypothetical protein
MHSEGVLGDDSTHDTDFKAAYQEFLTLVMAHMEDTLAPDTPPDVYSV